MSLELPLRDAGLSAGRLIWSTYAYVVLTQCRYKSRTQNPIVIIKAPNTTQVIFGAGKIFGAGSQMFPASQRALETTYCEDPLGLITRLHLHNDMTIG